MKRKRKSDWNIVKTRDGISSLDGWAIRYRTDPVAEFYGVPYLWVRKTLSMWRKLGKPYKEDVDE